jgi:hypothetical protein
MYKKKKKKKKKKKDFLSKYWRAVDDISLEHVKLTGVTRTKDNVGLWIVNE